MIILRVTPREREILNELTCDGPGNQEIADRLHLSVDTVKTHIKHMLAQTDFTTRTELAVAILRNRVHIVPKHNASHVERPKPEPNPNLPPRTYGSPRLRHIWPETTNTAVDTAV
jgi:DNA-binding CsgD family transcriptional regulator